MYGYHMKKFEFTCIAWKREGAKTHAAEREREIEREGEKACTDIYISFQLIFMLCDLATVNHLYIIIIRYF